MRMYLLSCLRRARRKPNTSVFSVTLTGLTGGYAIIGDHASIGYTIDPDNGTDTVKWSNSSDPADPATYGTGAAPTDYTAGDGNPLYCHVTDGGETVTKSATIAYAAGTAPAVADGQSWVVDDTAVNIDASASGANLTFSYVMSGEPSGSDLTINSSTGAITGTLAYANVGSSGSGTITVTATDQYGRTYQDTFTYSYALRTQATGGADLDLSFQEDSAISTTDLTANWTTNGNTLTYAINGTALPTGLSVSSAGSMTGTPTDVTADATYTLRGTDEYGRFTDDTFTLEITAVAAAPTLDSVVFTDNNDGTPAELAITYTGDVTGYRVYMATGDSTFDSVVPSDGELYNETGGVSGVLEYANFAVGSNIDITGLTSTSNNATRIVARLIKSADGSGTSNAVVTAVSGLDFTAPSFSSAEVGTIDADTLEITATETLFGTVDYTDFTLTGNTITAASLSGGKIRLTLGTTATSGDDYTGDLSYSGAGSALVDGDGNALTTFSNQDVTNNVSAAAPSVVQTDVMGYGSFTSSPSVSLPSGITDGNLLIAVIYVGNQAQSITSGPSGWTQVGSEFGTSARSRVYKKVASGDSGASFGWTMSGSTNACVAFAEVSDASTVEITSANGTVDCPNHTPTGGSVETVWLASAAQERSYAISSYPSGYTDTAAANSVAPVNNSGGNVSAAIATKVSTAASEDPGAFAWASSYGGDSVTISVRA